MENEKDFFDEFVKILNEKLGSKTKITMESNLKDLGLDSLDLVEIVLDAEERLGITFENEELLSFKTVGDVVKCARGKL